MRSLLPYLPPPVAKDDPFAALYADSIVGSSPNAEVTSIKRIRPKSTMEQVYRRLPSAADFEYFGYLTKTQIAYGEGLAMSAPYIDGKMCQFHSHPTDQPSADMPSPNDVYFFLKWPCRRAITVGQDFIWWWDKEPSLVKTVRRFNAWEDENQVAYCRRLYHKDNWMQLYMEKAMAAMGCKLSRSKQRPALWIKHLWQTLRLRTYLLDRQTHK